MPGAQSHDPHGLEAADLQPDARFPEDFLKKFAAVATALAEPVARLSAVA